nr:protein involved in de novo 2 [Quercus suber]
MEEASETADEMCLDIGYDMGSMAHDDAGPSHTFAHGDISQSPSIRSDDTCPPTSPTTSPLPTGITPTDRQKEELHKRIIQLQKQLDAKQALELEIERLRGSLNVMKHMGDDGDVEILEIVDTILKQLRDKGELEDLEALNQTLIVKERKSNDELQEA